MTNPLRAALLLALLTAACADGAESGMRDTTATAQDASARTAPPRLLAEVVQRDDRFGTLTTALDSAGLADTLRTSGPFTLFAPTNAAFEGLPEGTLAELLRPANRERLRTILRYHIAEGSLSASVLQGRADAPTLEGNALPVRASGGALHLGSPGRPVSVIETDVPTSNGVLHALDAVLMPPNE